MNTIENNRLIAEFMGVQVREYSTGGISYNPDKSWELLMPVVKRINSLKDLGLWNKHNIDRYNLTEALNDVEIEEVYELIILFISWYNKDKGL